MNHWRQDQHHQAKNQLRRRRAPPVAPTSGIWSMDFMCRRAADGGMSQSLIVVMADDPKDIIKVSQVEDAFKMLDGLVASHGLPKAIYTDRGQFFSSRPFLEWARVHGVEIRAAKPGKPSAIEKSAESAFRTVKTS